MIGRCRSDLGERLNLLAEAGARGKEIRASNLSARMFRANE